jgi:SAM-dependent methyltransferase
MATRQADHRGWIMRRRSVVAGTIVAGVGAVAARRPLKAHWAEGTLPGRSGSWLNSCLNRPSYRLMAAAVDLTPEDDLLDVACGSGEFLAVHAAQARRVAGIDLSEAKVALARERLAGRIGSGTAEVVRGDAAALPWAEGAFSAVTCNDAFPFFPVPERVLAEIRRVLRPGGRMVMQIGMRWPNGVPKHMPHPKADFDVADEAAVRRLVEDAGFGEVAISYGRVGGDSRLGNLMSRLLGGSDEVRLVRAVRPKVPARRRPRSAARGDFAG